MRLIVRSSVDLPQPDGPMNAVTRALGDVEVHVLQRVELAVVEVELARSRHLRRRRRHAAAARATYRCRASIVVRMCGPWLSATEAWRNSVRARMLSDEHRQRDQQRAAPRERLPVVERAHRELEDHDRQVGHRRVHVAAAELVVERGEEQRRGLAGDARDREQHAGDDAAAHRAQRHHQDHLPHRRAERHRRLAQAVRHQLQHVLGGAHHHRHGDQRERHRARPAGEVLDRARRRPCRRRGRSRSTAPTAGCR